MLVSCTWTFTPAQDIDFSRPGLFMNAAAEAAKTKPRFHPPTPRRVTCVNAREMVSEPCLVSRPVLDTLTLRSVEGTEREKPRRVRGLAAVVGIHE
jgi:hypothetical protein